LDLAIAGNKRRNRGPLHNKIAKAAETDCPGIHAHLETTEELCIVVQFAFCTLPSPVVDTEVNHKWLFFERNHAMPNPGDHAKNLTPSCEDAKEKSIEQKHKRSQRPNLLNRRNQR
jgi:hypothetical protein